MENRVLLMVKTVISKPKGMSMTALLVMLGSWEPSVCSFLGGEGRHVLGGVGNPAQEGNRASHL